MEPQLLRPGRKGTLLSLAAGAVFGVIGLALLLAGRLAGIGVLAIAAVGVYGGIGGFWPGIGLRLDAQGLRVRSFGKSWGAQWLEIERFEPTRIEVGRYGGEVEAVRIHYVGCTHEPRHRLGGMLGIDERYVIAAYGGLDAARLAALLERYRTG